MRWILLVAVSVVAVARLGDAGKLPAYAKRCDRKQSDLKACLVNACQELVSKLNAPIPEVGLPTLEPLEIPAISVGAGSGPVNVDQNYKDVKIFGLSKIQVADVQFDFANKVLNVAGFIPEVKMVAQYDLNGKILLLPIVGTGPSTLKIENVQAKMMFPWEEVEKKGKKHFKVHDSVLTFDPEHVTYNFENLFNGDKALGDNINKVLNENWKEVFDDVKIGYEKAYGLTLEGLANQVFSKVAISEIFLNEK